MAVPDHPEANRRFGTDPPTLDALERAPLDTMPNATFDSTNVHSALYDWGERELYIRYLRAGPDAVYQYWNVGPDTWDSLKLATSKGSYINANIAYEYEYALFGRDEFPTRQAITNDLVARFVHDP